MRNIRQLLVAFLMSAVVACGGGGTIGDDGTTVVPTYSLAVALSGEEVAKGTDLVVTAELKSSSSAAVSGKLIRFSLDDSALASFDNGAATSVTDANGKATIGLKVGTKSGAGIITATFDSGSASSSATVGTVSFRSKGDGGVVDTTPVRSVLLSADKLELGTGGTDRVELFAIVKDDNNILMKNVPVQFSADGNADLEIVSSVTGADGIAKAYLSSKTDFSKRSINVTATAGANQVSSKATINVVGTSIDVLAPAAVVLGGSTKLTIALLDATGKGIKNTQLEISSSLGNSFSNTTPVTDAATGRVVVDYQATNGGSDIITVSALGVTNRFSIFVDPDAFAFEPASNNVVEIPLNTASLQGIKWTRNNSPLVGNDVSFTTTRGEIAAVPDDVTPAVFEGKVAVTNKTDDAGKSRVAVRSDYAGLTNISASSTTNGSKISTNKLVEFIATESNKIEVQAFPAQIGPGEKATVQAIVRDAKNNPVKNQVIAFSLAQSAGGQLSPATSTTNSQGVATTEFTADSNTAGSGTPQDPSGLRINAVVVSNTAVKGDTGISVGRRTLFFRFGTGGEVQTIGPNLTSVPYAIIVTDASGNPVPNQELNVAVTPRQYLKGEKLRVPEVGSFIRWDVQIYATCPSEDANRNGILDDGEDTNLDKLITPGNVATINRTVVADVNGIAQVNLIYPREYAPYTIVDIQVTATAQGTENISSRSVALTRLNTDYNREENPPKPSPFGIGNLCTNTI
ncbi:MAG TPA: hypothetical protein DF774_13430 [Rheinheimera sp.]|uniref:Ig-like domain-containing protein n=1 Tax=unclassified Rheinheimera TaxID=115860 RepID=UPI000ECC5C86|nr:MULTISPECIES: Ig-like domain-containing protein [unclassified Rheinheimera]MCT6699587.1 Ig-like domain-containing protein [Rheinheimera sp. 4Y26]HCU66752.1 hypothetical protein [Rheinheimera sp.]